MSRLHYYKTSNFKNGTIGKLIFLIGQASERLTYRLFLPQIKMDKMISGLFVEKLFLVKPFVNIQGRIVRLLPSGSLIYGVGVLCGVLSDHLRLDVTVSKINFDYPL
jgi:hypothetical protein